MLMSDGGGARFPRRLAIPEGPMAKFARDIVHRLFSVGLSLESARSIVADGPAADRIAAATEEVDLLIRDLRTATLGPDRDRPALLRERMTRMAREFQDGALSAADLLERRASHTRPPTQVDYQAEVKCWRGIADQADQMAKRWQ